MYYLNLFLGLFILNFLYFVNQIASSGGPVLTSGIQFALGKQPGHQTGSQVRMRLDEQSAH